MKIDVDTRFAGKYGSAVTRIFQREVAPNTWLIQIETTTKRPQPYQWVTGGNLSVHGIRVYSDSGNTGEYTDIIIEGLKDDRLWHLDITSERNMLRCWLTDIDGGYTAVWEKP